MMHSFRFYKNKNAIRSSLVLLFGFLLVFFYASHPTLAANQCTEEGRIFDEAKGKCICKPGLVPRDYVYPDVGPCITSEERSFTGTPNDPNVADNTPSPGIYGDKGMFGELISKLLEQVFTVVGWLMGIAAIIFDWVVQPANITGILNMDVVYEIWTMVRDLLNMAFIMMLLFSAFATIFQVDKYHIKKIWLTMLINALLVNFSFPIARFVIDIGNVIMYSLLNGMFKGATTGFFSTIASNSEVTRLLIPTGKDFADLAISYQIMTIIFIFVLGATFLVLAVMFLVRLVALSILVMFAPVGFVGYVIPAATSYAKKWWDNLFKYTFCMPILVVFIGITINMMEGMGRENVMNSVLSVANNNVDDAGLGSFLAGAVFMTIPVIILWTGITVTQGMCGGAGKSITAKAAKFGNWLKGGILGAPGGLAGWGWNATGIPGSTKKAWTNFKKDGKLFGKQIPLAGVKSREEREDRWSGYLSGGEKGFKGAKEKQDMAAIKEAMDKKDMQHMDEVALRTIMQNNGSSNAEEAAALLRLAEKGMAGADDVRRMAAVMGNDHPALTQLRNKMRSYDPVSAFSTFDEKTGRRTLDTARLGSFFDSNEFDYKKVKVGSLGDAEFMKVGIDKGAFSLKDLNDLAAKGDSYSEAIGSSLDKALSSGDYTDVTKEQTHREMQLAFLARKGELHESIAKLEGTDNAKFQEAKQEIFKAFDKNTAKEITTQFVERHGADMVKSMNAGKIGEVILAMEDDQARMKLVDQIASVPITPDMDRHIKSMQKKITNDDFLSGFVKDDLLKKMEKEYRKKGR